MPPPESANGLPALEPEYSRPSDPGVANTGEEARISQPELEVSPVKSESGEPEPDAGMEAPSLPYHEIPVPEDEVNACRLMTSGYLEGMAQPKKRRQSYV